MPTIAPTLAGDRPPRYGNIETGTGNKKRLAFSLKISYNLFCGKKINNGGIIMDNQEFQQHVLKWMERMEERQQAYEERMDARLASFEERVDKRLGSLEQTVSWIKGKLEGRAEWTATLRANIAIGISIIVGIGSLLLNLWRR